MLRVVIDTNIWIRILLRGKITLPILEVWRDHRFQLVSSQALLEEFDQVWRRPRLQKRIDAVQAEILYRQMKNRAELIDPQTIPPHCRDVKDHPVLATAIDGNANIILSGDDDLRADERLRAEMADFGIEILGVQSFLLHFSTD